MSLLSAISASDDGEHFNEPTVENREGVLESIDEEAPWPAAPRECEIVQSPPALRECEICFEEKSVLWKCNGKEAQHAICSLCFRRYVAAELGPLGSMERQRSPPGADQEGGEGEALAHLDGSDDTSGPFSLLLNTETLSTPPEPPVSQPGDLPCFKFMTGDCDCAAIAPETIEAALRHSDQEEEEGAGGAGGDGEGEDGQGMMTLSRYQASRRRLLLGGDGDGDDGAANAVGTDSMEVLESDVAAAVVQGQIVLCPTCSFRPHINIQTGFIHVTCHRCHTRFCYICGGTRPCRAGCDAVSPLFYKNPGWKNKPLKRKRGKNNDEDDTADRTSRPLLEFHRRRTAYFLRLVKERHEPALWDRLKQQQPHLFRDVPVKGMAIEWAEIDGATLPATGRPRVIESEGGGAGGDGDPNNPNQNNHCRILQRVLAFTCRGLCFFGAMVQFSMVVTTVFEVSWPLLFQIWVVILSVFCVGYSLLCIRPRNV